MRRTLTSTLAAAALALAVGTATVATATSAQAGTLSPSDGSYSVSVHDVALRAGCMDHPATYTVAVSGPWTLYVRPNGPRGGQPQYLSGEGPSKGSVQFQLCDWMGAGTYSVSAQLGWSDASGDQRVSLADTTFAVAKVATRITAAATSQAVRTAKTSTSKSTKGLRSIRVTGSTSAATGQAWQPVGAATVTVQYKTSGSSKWVPAGTATTTATGTFELSWTLRTSSKVTVRALLPATDVTAASVSKTAKA
jgi:hypothetical protein